MMSKTTSFIFVILTLSTSIARGQESITFLNSPNENYSVVTIAKEVGDANVEHLFLLVNRVVGDTTQLFSTTCHDTPPPNFFWLSDNLLLHELRHEFEMMSSSICIRDVDKENEVFRINGIIPHRRKYAENFLDRTNSILIFFRIGSSASNNNFEILRLNLETCVTHHITQLDDTFEIEFPTVHLNLEKRKGQLEYSDFIDGKSINLSFDY